jgi:hypothetical protein
MRPSLDRQAQRLAGPGVAQRVSQLATAIPSSTRRPVIPLEAIPRSRSLNLDRQVQSVDRTAVRGLITDGCC